MWSAGVPRSQETAFPQDPAVGLCLGPFGGPRGGAVSYERGTPILIAPIPLQLRALEPASNQRGAGEARRTPPRAVKSGNVQWFRGGLVFEAHRLSYHSA